MIKKKKSHNKKSRSILYKNKKYDTLNKKLIEYCREKEINNLKMFDITNRNNDFVDLSKTNRVKNPNNIFKKIYSNYKIKKDKNLFKSKNNLMDYLNNNDSCSFNNYKDLISVEFPLINSYFHNKIDKKIKLK